MDETTLFSPVRIPNTPGVASFFIIEEIIGNDLEHFNIIVRSFIWLPQDKTIHYSIMNLCYNS